MAKEIMFSNTLLCQMLTNYNKKGDDDNFDNKTWMMTA